MYLSHPFIEDCASKYYSI